MKNHSSSRFIATVALALVAAGSLLPLDAQAAGRFGRTTGPRDGTVSRVVTRQPGSVQKDTTYTSPAGKVSTRDVSRTYDKTTGEVTGSSKTTLANGKTASTSLESDKTDTGRTTTAERTGFNGKTSNYDSTKTKTKTADGFTRDATLTGPNGGTATKDVDVSHQDGTTTRTVTVTKTPPPKS